MHLDLRFPVLIPRIVVGELVWVLSHTHQLRRAAGVSLDEADQVQRALTSFENGRGDLADGLIAEQAISRVPDDRHFQRSTMSAAVASHAFRHRLIRPELAGRDSTMREEIAAMA